MKIPVFLFLALALPVAAVAELSLPRFFSDHMILQREREAMIRGTADPNADVTISFKGATATAKADSEGKWRAAIATGAADATGAPLVITSRTEKVELRDVLVGEVWFASGQSNMFFTMDRVSEYAEVIAATNLPSLRFFNAPLVTAIGPQDDIEGRLSS